MKKAFLTLLLTLAVSGFLHAKNYDLYDYGVSLWFPDDWFVESDDDFFEAKSRDSLATFICSAYYGEEELDQALTEVENVLDEMFEYYEYFDDIQSTEENGLLRYELEGTGNSDGTDLNFIIHVVKTPTDHYLLLIGFCITEYWVKYQDAMYAIVDTLKPLEGFL